MFFQKNAALVAFLLVLSFILKGQIVSAEKYNEAQYQLIEAISDTVEVRQYQPQMVADVTVKGDRSDAAGKGFRQLFAYISGENLVRQKVPMTVPVAEYPADTTNNELPKSESIKMTTPVTELNTSDGWVIRFFLPSTYTLDNTPTPKNPHIKISQTVPRKMAAIRFSGFAGDEKLEKKAAILIRTLQGTNYDITGSTQYAFYDSPFTLPFFRRNEVLVPVTRTNDSTPSNHDAD